MLLDGHSVLTARRTVHDSGNFFCRQRWRSFRFSIQNLGQRAMRLATGGWTARARFFHIGREINHEVGNCEYAFLRNWRRHSDRLSFTNGFGNDRVTRAHH